MPRDRERERDERETLDYAPVTKQRGAEAKAEAHEAGDQPRMRRSRRWQAGAERTLPGLRGPGDAEPQRTAEPATATPSATVTAPAPAPRRRTDPAPAPQSADHDADADAETDPPPALTDADAAPRPTQELLWTSAKRKRRRRKRSGVITSPGLISAEHGMRAFAPGAAEIHGVARVCDAYRHATSRDADDGVARVGHRPAAAAASTDPGDACAGCGEYKRGGDPACGTGSDDGAGRACTCTGDRSCGTREHDARRDACARCWWHRASASQLAANADGYRFASPPGTRACAAKWAAPAHASSGCADRDCSCTHAGCSCRDTGCSYRDTGGDCNDAAASSKRSADTPVLGRRERRCPRRADDSRERPADSVCADRPALARDVRAAGRAARGRAGLSRTRSGRAVSDCSEVPTDGTDDKCWHCSRADRSSHTGAARRCAGGGTCSAVRGDTRTRCSNHDCDRDAPTAAGAAETAAPTAAAAPTATAATTAPTTTAPPESATRVTLLLEQARALEQQGKPRQAIELYEQAAALQPNVPEVLSRLAFNYLNRGQNQQASEYAARALAVDPTSSEGWIVLGAARHALGDAHGARDAYRKCVEVGRGAYVEECRRVAR